MGVYIDAKKRTEMVALIDEFYLESKDGKEINRKCERIMSNLFTNYVDKIAIGTIRSPYYKFYKYAEEDELMCIAREEVYKAILKKSWKPEKSSIFTFFTTVVANNLRQYTKKKTKKENRFVYTDIDEIVEEDSLLFREDKDEKMLSQYIFIEMEEFFERNGKHKFGKLARIFKEFFYNQMGSRFKKKDFIEYAKSEGYSTSTCNLFFDTLRKNKILKDLYFNLSDTNFGKEK